MDRDLDIDSLWEKARNHLAALTEAHSNTWLKADGHWDVDQDSGILSWQFPDGIRVSAPLQIIGTYDTKAGTFLWSWANPSIAENCQQDARKLLIYGQERGIEILQERKIECDTDIAWDLTALATLLCDSNGAYCGPTGHVLVFMTFGQITMKKQR